MQHHSKSIFFLVSLVVLLSGCDYMINLPSLSDTENLPQEEMQVSFGVAPHINWMPWYLANEENAFRKHGEQYNIEVAFESDTYLNVIDKFINKELEAIVIYNIDAIAQFVQRSIEADIILITDYSDGNESILIKEQNLSTSIKNQQVAVREYSVQHYLLDRFLIKNIIDFETVEIIPSLEKDIVSNFELPNIYGVATSNPNAYQLLNQQQALLLYDSRDIPKEITSLVAINRDALIDNPNYPHVILATWFSIMNRMQGGRRGPALDAMAKLANMPREEFEIQIESVILNDTPNSALSAIRDRGMRKTMRNIRYFMERHGLTGEEEFSEWVSYPGRDKKLLHYNAQPLQTYIIPPKATNS